MSIDRKTALVVLVVILLLVFMPGTAIANSAEETSFIRSTETYKRLKAEIDKLRVIDNHEHLPPDNIERKRAPDFFDLVTVDYTGADIKTLGNTFFYNQKYLDRKLSVKERWESFLPIYERLRNTGYMRCLKLGIKKIHGLEITDASSIERLNTSMANLYKPGMYKKILFDLGRIDCVLVYRPWDQLDRDLYPDFFRFVRVFDREILFHKPEDIHRLEERYAVSVHTLKDLEVIYRRFVEASIREGAVGFKSAAAYVRPIDYEHFSREKAELLLKKLLTFSKAPWMRGEALTSEEGMDLTNICMHLLLKIIEEKGLPVSFHTGMQTQGRMDVRWSHPQLLIPLFRKYRNLNFDILHGGFPYVNEFIELGKSWPNVYLNLCWNHVLTPQGTRAQLSEMLECVPVNKIFAFGADTFFLESTIGHLEMARENCALVLAEKVLNGIFTHAEALDYAERIFRTNTMEFFKLRLKDQESTGLLICSFGLEKGAE